MPQTRRYRPSASFSGRNPSGRFAVGFDSRAKTLTSVAIALILALAFSVSAKKVRPPLRNYLVESIDSVSTKAQTQSNVPEENSNARRNPAKSNEHKSHACRKVYICTGHLAYCYHHNKKCSGLKSCGGPIVEISSDSIPSDRQPCSICVKTKIQPPSRSFFEDSIR